MMKHFGNLRECDVWCANQKDASDVHPYISFLPCEETDVERDRDDWHLGILEEAFQATVARLFSSAARFNYARHELRSGHPRSRKRIRAARSGSSVATWAPSPRIWSLRARAMLRRPGVS